MLRISLPVACCSQAAIGAKPFARERVAPYRKDVLLRNGKVMGGGDVTRKMKLLSKQKEGKKRSESGAAGRLHGGGLLLLSPLSLLQCALSATLSSVRRPFTLSL